MVTCATTVTYERCPTHESYHTIQDMAWRTRGGGRLRDDIYVTLSRSRLRSGAFYARDAAAHQYSPLRAKHLQVECVGLVTQQEGIYTAGWGGEATHLHQGGAPRKTTMACYASQPRFLLRNRQGEACVINSYPQLKHVGAHAG